MCDVAYSATAPAHEEPAPAVQPKQWRSVTTRRGTTRPAASSADSVCGAPWFDGIASIWLKSQS